jgi:excisionase family DNA binding protein
MNGNRDLVQTIIRGETSISSKDREPAPQMPNRIGSLRSQQRGVHEETGVSGDPLSRLLTVEEVAAMLNVPRKWVYRRVALQPPNGIPHVKVGKYVRFRESDLRNYVERLRRS